MKILLLNVIRNFGSTGSITNSLFHDYQSYGHDTYFIYGRGKKVKEDKVYKCGFELEANVHHFFSLINGNIYGGVPFSTLKLIHLIKKINPEVIHIHCINGYFVNIYSLFKWLKKKPNIKVILTNHAEFMYSGNCPYLKDCTKYMSHCEHCKYIKENNGKYSLDKTKKYFFKMKKALENMPNMIVTGVSPWVSDRISKSKILGSYKPIIVFNGLNLENVYLDDEDPFKNFRYLNKKIIISVINDFIDSNKGGKNLFILSKELNDEYLIVDVGNPPLDINLKDYRNIIFIGKTYHKQIYNLYAHSYLTLLLSYEETFSMVVAESLVSGTPVVGFKAGGPESISLKEYSTFVEYGNIKGLVDAIYKQKPIDRIDCMRKARKLYDSRESAKKYLELMK